jgi:hypothetical protein
MLTLVFWNPRGILNKQVEAKEFLTAQGAAYAGISESQTYKSGQELSDSKWRWDAGTEFAPSVSGARPAKGVGAFVDTTKVVGSLIRTDKYTVWHRVETLGGENPIVVGVGYWPKSTDVQGHIEANRELSISLALFREQNYRVIFGGDLNAHTGAGKDNLPQDTAGTLMLQTAAYAGMVLVHTMPGKCSGGEVTRRQVQENGIQESWIDYVMCSDSLTHCIKSMVVDGNLRGSDHFALVIKLDNLQVKLPEHTSALREVWRLDEIKSPPECWSWVDGCQERFSSWITHTHEVLRTAQAAGVEAAGLADVIEHSFQVALDEVAAEHIGTKWVGPKATPILDAAARGAIKHRDICQDVLLWTMRDVRTPEHERRAARTQFTAASRAVVAVAAQRRHLAELKLFRNVEQYQGNSKVFWDKFKKLHNSIVVSKSPPPVAVNADGITVTEPVEVLRAWRDFCASIASADLEGTREEGIYNEEYKCEVEDRLKWLRSVCLHQPNLDHAITAEEVFTALRKLRMGSAPGEDGLLTNMLKTAAHAVNTNKLRPAALGGNSVVDSIVLLFNYIFESEVWPARWSTGVIVPLHKGDSRLDPANYRPITLMAVMGKLFGSIINARLQDFSERTGSISDYQGGFRRGRGTNDQIFLLREILASRKERAMPTYATYIDVRKAYDTVWREQAYVRIHDSGVKGRLWRQLQAMHANLTRVVRHPLGMTDSFPVERGVAQGAVESPWIYASFIDGLAAALKEAGLGIWIAGEQVPLLMYADDVVMLASSQDELAQMNAVATAFAHHNRFEFNGKKSGVMAFAVTTAQRARCTARAWKLFGEKVKVVAEYEYLGTTTPLDGLSWRKHVDEAITKAKHRSNDLLWIFGGDKGMRARTAITLWQSLVRPQLEYASEVWAGQVTQEQTLRVEQVQMKFLRGTLGLHEKGSGVADEVVRAETGCERIRDRWTKLQLGYFRRLFAAPATRLLRKVAEFRWGERVHMHRAGGRYGTRGWMASAETALTRVGLQAFWDRPADAAAQDPAEWGRVVYVAVDTTSDAARTARMVGLSSATTYTSVKDWGRTPKAYAFSSGEVGLLGQHVHERYLDDRVDLKGARLKMLCRTGCLPTMERVGREVRPKWAKERRTCMACNEGAVETVQHFILDCPNYEHHRKELFCAVDKTLTRALDGTQIEQWRNGGQGHRLRILLGGRIGDPPIEDRIDRSVKRFLRKAWNKRAPIGLAINTVLGTKYDVK